MIKNKELIKTLIKNDRIPISLIDEIDFVLTEIKAESIEDFEEFVNYINWYTICSKLQGYSSFNKMRSFEIYVTYLKTFPKKDRDNFPKKDIYSLTENYLRIKDEKEIESAKEAYSQYDNPYWDKITKEVNICLEH